MAYLRDIITSFEIRTIRVELDPLLLNQIDHPDKIITTRDISFNLYKLIYRIGTIQSRRFAPSNRNKYFDSLDLVEKIILNTNEFRVKIDDIRNINGSETLTSVSEDFGVGISIMIAENLFNIKPATISKIYGNTKRPDWKCQTNTNQVLVVECKGSTNHYTSNTQLNDSLIQKRTIPGDIQIASVTLIKEDAISTTRFIDPPGEESEYSAEMENNILRAAHYASVFSFFGNSKLSRYFSSLRKRISGQITRTEQEEKNQVYEELNNTDPILEFNNREYSGHFFNVEEGKYLFVGVDIHLLSYQGFLEFSYYPEDLESDSQDNKYMLFNDGVLIIEIENTIPFNDVVNFQQILNYQEKITISDIDEMNEISFIKYLKHKLKEENFIFSEEVIINRDLKLDLLAEKNNRKYGIEVKLYKNKKITIDTLRRFGFIHIPEYELILITNATVKLDEQIDLHENIKVIDRNKLNLLAKGIKTLEQLMTMPTNG